MEPQDHRPLMHRGGCLKLDLLRSGTSETYSNLPLSGAGPLSASVRYDGSNGA